MTITNISSYILVTLWPINGAGATFFRGFLIQPRLAADDTTVVGLFAAPGAGDIYQQSSCATPLVLLMSVVLLTIA